MAKKLIRTLLSAALSGALAIGAMAITTYAAEKATNGCTHNYCILNDFEYNYHYMNSDRHKVTGWEEYYCMDCGAYWTESINYSEEHTLPCSDCGAN